MFVPRLIFCQIYFDNNYENNSNTANATSVIVLDTGGYLFPSCVFGNGYSSILILKVGLNGDTIWTREYPKTSTFFSTGTSNSTIKTYDNNYVFCGAETDSSNTWNALLVKINGNGDTLWTKVYGGPNDDNANMVCQTPDSGFVLMGFTQSFSNGTASDFYLIKTDKNGNFQWQHAYGTTAAEDCVSGQITLDGGYMMSGHRAGTLHIVKTDSNGNFQWEKVYPGTEGQAFIKQLPDSSYIMVGAKNVTGLAAQAFMAKLTKTGNVIWQQTYGGAGDQQFYAVPIILNDGSIVCSGVSTLSTIPWGLLVKTDSSGNQQWLRTYYKSPSSDNYIYDVRHTSDNGFIMSGFALVLTSDPWLVKIDSNGCEVAGCNVGIEDIFAEGNNINVYPNPASSELRISSNKPRIKKMKINNVLGGCVYERDVENEKKEISVDVSGLVNGMYFVEVMCENKMYNMKFIKQ